MNRALRHFLKPYGAWLLGLAVIMFISTVLEGLTLAAFFPVFLAILQQPTAAGDLPGVVQAAARLMRFLPWTDPVLASTALLAGLMVSKFIVLLLRDALIAVMGGKVLYDVKQQLMRTYAQLPYQHFINEKRGTLLYQTMVAPVRVALVLQRIPQVLAETLKAAIIVAVLVSSFPQWRVALMVVGLLYYAVMRLLSTTVAYDTGVARSAAQAEETEVVHQFFGGIRQLRVFQATSHWLDRFETASRAYHALYVRYLMWLAVPRNLIELLVAALLLGTIMTARFRGGTSLIAWLPEIGLFAVALVQLLPSFGSIGRMGMELREAQPDVDQLYGDMIRLHPFVKRGGRVLARLAEGIRFEHVTFRYPERPAVLRNVSFACPRGRVTAIVGPSGSGKTTIVNLLLGLIEPTEGQVLVDGKPLSDYELRSWFSHVGFVSQDPFIVHGTVEENIVFGRSGYSRDDVIRAAKLAHAHQFVEELPQGYATVVGERGAKLSGGQQQRIAIARAVLGEPEVLVFDEATSALDPVSEQLVQEAIAGAAKNRTVVMVTHGDAVIRQAHRVVVLDRGTVVREGPPELVRQPQGALADAGAAAQQT